MSVSEADENPIEVLASLFVERQRRGEDPAIDEYAAKYPRLAGSIRELFPTIAALEKVRARQVEWATRGIVLGPKKLSRLGDFRIVREIGRGGMGIVYEAVQESLGRRVAVKILARNSRLDDVHRRRFLREARTAGRLHHTNIVPVLGVGEQEGLDYYVMQYIDGVSLDAVIAQLRDSHAVHGPALRLSSFWRPIDSIPSPASETRTLPNVHPSAEDTQDDDFEETADPPAEAPPLADAPADNPSGDFSAGETHPGRRLCRTYWQDVALVGLQVAQALDYAHSQGALHRDIKPANLLIDRRGTVWIADFGLAKGIEHEAVSRTGEILGTLRYMAPEQWRGHADARSDIYSLGVTLYELLTWRIPGDIPGRMQAPGQSILQRATRAPREIAPSLPVDLETIVMKAIADEPERRYQTAGELAADLARFLEDQPIAIRRPTLVERWSRWRRQNPAAALLSAISAVLLVLLAVVFAVGYLRTSAALRRESVARDQESQAKEDAQVALKSESQQRKRAEAMLETSFATLNKVFERLVPNRLGETRSLALTSQNGTGSQPVVSPETAALLQDLRAVYDTLGTGSGTDARLAVESARASRRVGDIYSRLGDLERAEAAYQDAIKKYQSLTTRDPAGPFRLEIARLHNALGPIYGRRRKFEPARKEYVVALGMLQEPFGAKTSDERFELAHTYYLLGSDQGRQAGPVPGTNTARRMPPPPDRNRPPGPNGPFGGDRPPKRDHRSDEGGPPRGDGPPHEGDEGRFQPAPPPDRADFSGRMRDGGGAFGPPADQGPPGRPADREALGKAIAILEALIKEQPENPEYRYLLAQCYREEPHSGPLPETGRAEQLLKELVAKYPGVPDYRFELADTYALLDLPRLPPEKFSQAERRLRAALKESADLVDEHPYAPDYAILHVHILLKLAEILRHLPPDQGGDQQARVDEAAQHYQEAVRRQQALIKRFPDNADHHFWLARIRLSIAELWLERREFLEAQTTLKQALTEADPFLKAHADAAPLRGVVRQLQERLSEAGERLQAGEPERDPPPRPDSPGHRPPGGPPDRPRRHPPDHPRSRPPHTPPAAPDDEDRGKNP